MKVTLAYISASMSLSPCNVRSPIPMYEPLEVFFRGTWGHPFPISQFLGLSSSSSESHPCLYSTLRSLSPNISYYHPLLCIKSPLSFSLQPKNMHSHISTPWSLSPCNSGSPFPYSNPCSVSLCNIRRPFPYFIFNLRLSFHLFKLLGPFLSACYDLPFLFQLLEQQNGDLSHRLFKLIWVFLQAT